MRLSEAILRGTVLLSPSPGRFVDDSGTSGCIMGMAAVGVEAPQVLGAASSLKKVVASEIIRQRWPWILRYWHYELLCGCKLKNRRLGLTGWRYRGLDVIIHTFDEHVSASTVTMEQLLNWIRSVEPGEPLKQALDSIPLYRADLVEGEPIPETGQDAEPVGAGVARDEDYS